MNSKGDPFGMRGLAWAIARLSFTLGLLVGICLVLLVEAIGG